jgi:hypothetical protein
MEAMIDLAFDDFVEDRHGHRRIAASPGGTANAHEPTAAAQRPVRLIEGCR